MRALHRFVLFFGPAGVAFALAACSSGRSTGGTGATVITDPPKQGNVGIAYFQGSGGMGTSYTQVILDFTDSTENGDASTELTEAGTPAVCTPEQIGACAVTSCVSGAPPPGGPRKNTAPAGDITITDTTTGESHVYSPGGGSGSDQYYQQQAQFNAESIHAGDSFTFSAAGGDVGAFTQTLALAAPVTLAQTLCPDGGSGCPVSRSADFAVTWTGGAAGTTLTLVMSANGAGCTNAQNCPQLQSTAKCKFDAAAGSGVIPKEVLMRFPEQNIQLQPSIESAADLVQGGYTIHVSVSAGSTSSNFGYTLGP